MSVLKNKTQGNFIMVSNTIAHDTSLCLTDRGLLLTLLSLPDNWHLTIKGLCAILPDGKDKISKSLNRLIALGYVTRLQTRNDEGRFGDIDLEVHSSPVREKKEPQPDNPTADNPPPDYREAEKQAQYNNTFKSKSNEKKSTTSTTGDLTDTYSNFDAAADILRNYNLSKSDVRAIYLKAKGDIATIKKAIEALEAQPGPINSVVGWMIWAIEQGYDVPSPKVKKRHNAFNALSLARDYDFDVIEKKLVNKNRTEWQKRS